VNAPWAGAPNPNAAGVVPFCPCPVAPKLNGDVAPPPVDVEGVTGVKTNGEGLKPVAPFVVEVVVAGGLGALKENVGLFVAGVGMDGVVPNALTGVDVVPNALPFADRPGPGLKPSCLGALSENIPCEVPVVVGLVEFVDGKVTFWSDPPAGLFAEKLNWG